VVLVACGADDPDDGAVTSTHVGEDDAGGSDGGEDTDDGEEHGKDDAAEDGEDGEDDTGSGGEAQRCDPDAPFSTIRWLDELNALEDDGAFVGAPWPMPDELRLWVDVDWQLLEFSRASVDEPFGNPQPIPGLQHATQNRYAVSLSPDGLRAYFLQSTPDVFNTEHPEMATRDSIDLPFSETWALGLGHPDARISMVRHAAGQLFYLQALEGTPTQLLSDDQSDGQSSGTLTLPASEHSVSGYAVTTDALFLYFTERVEQAEGESSRRTQWTVRESVDDPFLPPIDVDGVADLVPRFNVRWVSEDRCVMYGIDSDSTDLLVLERDG